METTETINQSSSLLDKGKLFIKGIIIFGMALGLWIPTYFIMGLVKERKSRQKEAVADISNKWAGKQTITGPLLMIPYNEFTKDEKGNAVVVKHRTYFLPDKSEIQSKVFPEKRYRGIYQVIVYRSDISINGKFNPLQWEQLKIPAENILWNEAALLFQVQDNLRGINEDLYIHWADSNLVFNPQAAGLSGMKDAFAASLFFSAGEALKEHSFSMKFSLNGSEQLLFAAAARENKLQMQSSWPDPSFTGVKLPDTRELKDSGFVANWKYMNRSVPQVWNDNYYDLSQAVIGADLLIPVDSYNKTERSVKYALLCFILTFAVFFLIETIYSKSIHLVQYGLAGLALVLFYTLLLSISEYTGFNPAYLIAGVATIGLVAWYVGSVMKSSKLALFISFVLAIVYVYIFTIIQLQDYALLMGSIGLFLALAIIMYFSRKLQW
ncbi:MAG: cell envelope integrity protein CreD [Chitinophagaceae bacterium]|nr:MAG: cell envelope integrity protein CreD [Chitinophagaceae bacterium]